MKVIIAGSRDSGFNILDIYKAVNKSRFIITEIVSGNARGVDQLGELYAIINNIRIMDFPADWNNKGKSAGIIRNKQMGDYADALIALWDEKSKGTNHMINYMKSINKPTFVYTKPLKNNFNI